MYLSIRIVLLALTGLLASLLLACSSSQKKPANQPNWDDRANTGTSFNEVMAVLKSNPYDPTKLPIHNTTINDIQSPQLLADSGRTLDSGVDIRTPFRRILHPNGICLAGEWLIDRPNPYSGVFKSGSRFPIIARVSPPNRGLVTRGFHPQSVGLVGKVFPSSDRATNLHTANFITQTDLGGYVSARSKILDSHVEMTNAPGVTAIHRGLELPAFGILGNVLNQVDLMTTQRQLYPLAEAAKSGERTRTPKFMKLNLSPAQDTPGDGEAQDLRLELWNQLANGHSLVYDITVSDEGEVVGPVFLQRSWIHWNNPPIGRIEFHEAILSGACDNQIHFQHPAWREDVNDPTSTVRREHGVAFGQPLIRDQVVLHGQLVSPQSQHAIFHDLDNIKEWPAWAGEALVASIRPGDKDGVVDVTFTLAGERVSSRCQHESAGDSAISLSCRDSEVWRGGILRPNHHDLTFLLSELPNGRTRINWGLVVRSRKALEMRNAIEAGFQKALEKRYAQD